MKIKETVTIPAVPEKQKERTIGFKCELCSKEVLGASDWRDGVDWERGYHIEETCIQYTFGENYGSERGGVGDETSWIFDICPDCFKNRLMIWPKEQGANFRVEDSDW